MSIIRSNIHRFNHNIAQYDAEKVKGGSLAQKESSIFEGIGVNVNNATSLETINVSGLNFSVEKTSLPL